MTDLAKNQPEKVKGLEVRLMNYLEEVHAEVLDPPKDSGVKAKNKGKDNDD